MHRNLERADGICAPGSGKVFYACGSNNFRGCCSVNACDLVGCPDEEEYTAAPIPTTTSRGITTGQIAVSTQNPFLSSFSTVPVTTGSAATSRRPGINDVSTTPPPTPNPTQTAGPSPSPSPGHSKTSIIAGIVSGAVAVSVIAALVWLLIRQRKQKQNNQIAQNLPRSPSKETLHNPRISRTLAGRDDCFAPFGGRFNGPRFIPGDPELSNSQSVPNFTRIPLESYETTHHAASNPSTPMHDRHDRDLSDLERPTTTSLPTHQHLSFNSLNSLPGHYPEALTPPPNTPTSTNITPTGATSDPAPHVPRLIPILAYPALQPSRSPPPDSATGSRRQTAHDKHTTPSPSELSGSGNGQRYYPPAWRCSELSGVSSLTSPVAGHSELEADVPTSFHTPAVSGHGHGHGNGYTQPIHPQVGATPIGLGVINSAAATTTTTTSRDNGSGPLRPNLDSRRDGEHIMSWATEGYGFHGGASASASAFRSAEDREG
ncbi:uncharacterized protein L3040_004578 [Drepanopeziza brunnea f. sp. 'multigermtubi']|uniref:Uncharacterized protein n=1 Tax=Marssonina brunnea f. sp. multigermtubi (strain MB_m1) TaxID=1072389 RepID=K1XJT5_MARBU|nr:uncharacterized protein MBM_00071 [Drepanopeziza brunnea f. sp. 'multigermtubi' MB_m1]EKD20958.1 hypothetical protein MBM_00071 [Drepanopeziza brunnea f. sp. 'multigermtubi' MB_m1]KAJ5042017.1 hypothetical protein L3040_004578 [Drepanopeziza brunnea f. sp. 'multigermtubi']